MRNQKSKIKYQNDKSKCKNTNVTICKFSFICAGWAGAKKYSALFLFLFFK